MQTNYIMWFPTEIFSQIKHFMLDYKKTFDRNILPSIRLQKPSKITNINPMFITTNFSFSKYIYEICYKVPRLDEYSELRLNKLGLTHYGPNANKKDEKRYLNMKNKEELLNLVGYREWWTSNERLEWLMVMRNP